MNPLLREKLEAEVSAEKDLERLARACREESDTDTLRIAASRMEAIFTEHFHHAYFDADARAFDAFLKDLRRSISSLTQ